MIQPVTNRISFKSTGIPQKNKPADTNPERSFIVRYADSFIKHSIDSAPVLSGLTLVWSCLDKSQGIPFKRALSNNIRRFFLPVMLVTSAVTAFLENRKMNQQKN